MKGKAAKPGIGSGLQNTKTIKTEKPANKKIGSGGLPSTYHANARACGTERGCK
jgi:hypothetical protein